MLLQRRVFDGAQWLAWAPAPGVTMSGEVSDGPGPSCVRDAAGMTHCFVRGDDNPNDAANANALWHRWYPASGQGWWENLGGTLTSVPSCVAAPDSNALACFGRGTDGALWGRRFDGNVWGAWQSAGGAVKETTMPSCVALAGGRVDCIIVDASGRLQHRTIGSRGAWQTIAGNAVVQRQNNEYNPRCRAAPGGGIVCYAIVETVPDQSGSRPELLRATLGAGGGWTTSILSDRLNPLDFSCIDFEGGNFHCFVLAGSGPSFAMHEFLQSDGQWRGVALQAPAFAAAANRLECVATSGERIDCFVASALGGPLAHTVRTPPRPTLTIRPRP
jgi:hypothetical protein